MDPLMIALIVAVFTLNVVPLILCVFTKYKFPVIWSLVIILTYQAYANNPWKENLWFVFIEYLIIFSFLIYEILYQLKLKKL